MELAGGGEDEPMGQQRGKARQPRIYNPWNINTHRLGYAENVQDYDGWERQHRNEEAEDEDVIWVKPHDRKRKRGMK